MSNYEEKSNLNNTRRNNDCLDEWFDDIRFKRCFITIIIVYIVFMASYFPIIVLLK